MSARVSVHVPDMPVQIRLLEQSKTLIIGRSSDCDLVIDHHSVSRRHAQIKLDLLKRWTIEDLGSKNGILIDGQRTGIYHFSESTMFAIGDVFCQFQHLLEDELTQHKARETQRRNSQIVLTQKLLDHADHNTILQTILNSILELAECQRGFLLDAIRFDQIRVVASAGINTNQLRSDNFSGSMSAVDRVILNHKPIFISNALDATQLKAHASVIGQGIRAIAALPLLVDDKLIGVAYVDNLDQPKEFTELDAELLEAFANQAATAMGALAINAQLLNMEADFSRQILNAKLAKTSLSS